MSYILNVILYGTDYSRITHLAQDYTSSIYKVDKIKIDINTIDEKDKFSMLNQVLRSRSIAGRTVFINADTMKPLRIRGMDDLDNVIRTTESLVRPLGKHMILLNRYLDSNMQSRYIGEYNSFSNVAVFQSFNPKGSDAFYLSDTAAAYLNMKFSKNMAEELFKYVYAGTIDAYSYNPNLFVYAIEDAPDSIRDQFYKSCIVDCNNILEDRRIEHNIALFFADNIILFWIFVVIIVCIICISLLKLFKIKI